MLGKHGAMIVRYHRHAIAVSDRDPLAASPCRCPWFVSLPMEDSHIVVSALKPCHADGAALTVLLFYSHIIVKLVHRVPELRASETLELAAANSPSGAFFVHVHLGIQIPGACGDFGLQTFSVLMGRFLANLFGGGRARSLSRFIFLIFFP